MLFEFGFYSSLLLIPFAHGIIYSILLLIKAYKTENKSSYWLSIFLFLCSLFIAPWMLGFAGWYDNQPYRDVLFYTPFQQLFFMGPIIFFYTQSLLNPSFKLSKKDLLHFLPGIFYLLLMGSFWVYDNFIFGNYYFYKDGMDKDFESWYQYSGFASMTIYFGLSILYYNKYKKLIVQVTSNADTLLFQWIRNYLFAFLSMIGIRLAFTLLSIIFPQLDSYQGTWWFFLMFSLVLYYIAVTGYSNSVSSKISFRMSVFDKNPILLTDTSDSNTNEEVIIDIEHELVAPETSPEIEEWKVKIEEVLSTEKLYQNPELTLTDIAKKLNTNAAVISRAINQGFKMNFNDLINNYRIEAVKKMLEQGEHKKSTLLGIAFDCGFNSKATFNRAFKKNTGSTPKEFLIK
jgi:AraC-like DNA-binding protein